MWYEGCYWVGHVISLCLFDAFIQDAYYGGSPSSSEDLVGPLFKIVSDCYSRRKVGWQSQNMSQPLPSPFYYGDRQLICSCDLIQFIVGIFMWPLDPNHLSQLSSTKIVHFSQFILWRTPCSAVVQQYFSLASHTTGFWLSVSFSKFFFQIVFILCNGNSCQFFSSLDVFLITKFWSQFYHVSPFFFLFFWSSFHGGIFSLFFAH